MTPTHLCWRCRECGKWSYAKRDPIAHHRWVETLVEDEVVGKHAVWCGPFDRYTAQLDTSKPQREALSHFGEPVGEQYSVEYVEDTFPF